MPSPDELYSRAQPPPEVPAEALKADPFFEGIPTEGKFYDARDEGKTNIPEGAPPLNQAEPEGEPDDILTEFDPRWQDEMEGLLFVGRVTHEFRLGGHKITIATPEAHDTLKAAMLIKQYQETAGALRALTLAALATCLVKVDGYDLPRGIMADGSDDMETRFNWVAKLHTAVVDGIYREYEDLEVRVAEAIDNLGKGGVPLKVPSVPG
jgi:hypothetical protein